MLLSEMLQTVIDDDFFENDDYQTPFRPFLHCHTYSSEPPAWTDAKTLSTCKNHPKLLARAVIEFIYSYQRLVICNLFNPNFDVKRKRDSLDNLCIYQKIMYSSLLEYLNASDMVRSDHDSMCSTVVVQIWYYPRGRLPAIMLFVDAKKHSTTLMNKKISRVVVRGIVLIIIVYLLSMRVE